MGYIYIIKNKINDKVYIGQTRGEIKDRFSKHLSMARYLKDKSDINIDIHNNCRHSLVGKTVLFHSTLMGSRPIGDLSILKGYFVVIV